MSTNILFDTQSLGLQVFWSLFKTINQEFPDRLGKTGFFVTNKDVYKKFLADNPDFIPSAGSVLNEWDIIKQAKKIVEPDFEYIDHWERRIGDLTLWNSVICDRRFNYTIRAQHVQDYRPVYDHEFILKVLEVSLRSIDEHFNQIKPDAVVGLNAVTLYDYLYYLIAKERGIPYLQLKLTRVENYVSFYTDPLDISPHIGDRIDQYAASPDQLKGNIELFGEAVEFVKQAKLDSLSYEGAISKKKKKPKGAMGGAVVASKTSLSKRVLNLVFNCQQDKHYPTARRAIFYTKVVKPFRRKRLQQTIFHKSDMAWLAEKKNYQYAVYPLNTEPEVALLVYGRPYRNQIETVRNIASCLPVSWKLVVKEHPNAMGYRSAGFYKKLREIPNVVLLGPGIDTNALVSEASLLAVVFGTIGLEAVLKNIPVITFCKTPYGSFPETMVRYVVNISTLSETIRDLLDNYRYDEWAVFCYIAAHIESSIKVNLFTDLLGKGGRERTDKTSSLAEQYKRLATYTLERISEEQKNKCNYK